MAVTTYANFGELNPGPSHIVSLVRAMGGRASMPSLVLASQLPQRIIELYVDEAVDARALVRAGGVLLLNVAP